MRSSTIVIGKKPKKKKPTIRIHDPENPEASIRRKPGAMKYSDAIVFEAYEAAKMGTNERGICAVLKIDPNTFYRWKGQYPLFALALKKGKEFHTKGDGKEVTFREYVYKQLDPDLKKLWDEINACEKEKNAVARMESIFANHGTRSRQHLFLYALTASNFNASKALRKVGLSHGRLHQWIETDPEFARLYKEIEWHKGNFFESALVRQVAAGDTGAVIFANRTFNKNRGYGVKVEHEVSGTITHEHTVDIDSLKLPMDIRRAILDAIEKQEENMKPGQLQIGVDNEDAIDAEFEIKEKK